MDEDQPDNKKIKIEPVSEEEDEVEEVSTASAPVLEVLQVDLSVVKREEARIFKRDLRLWVSTTYIIAIQTVEKVEVENVEQVHKCNQYHPFQNLPPNWSIGDAARAALFSSNFPEISSEQAAFKEILADEVSTM